MGAAGVRSQAQIWLAKSGKLLLLLSLALLILYVSEIIPKTIGALLKTTDSIRLYDFIFSWLQRYLRGFHHLTN